MVLLLARCCNTQTHTHIFFPSSLFTVLMFACPHLLLPFFSQQFVPQCPQSCDHFLFQATTALEETKVRGQKSSNLFACLILWLKEANVSGTCVGQRSQKLSNLSVVSFLLILTVAVVDEAQLQVSVVVKPVTQIVSTESELVKLTDVLTVKWFVWDYSKTFSQGGSCCWFLLLSLTSNSKYFSNYLILNIK